MRLRPELALVSVVGVALAATAALGATSRVGGCLTPKGPSVSDTPARIGYDFLASGLIRRGRPLDWCLTPALFGPEPESKITFTKAGKYKYICTVHDNMKGEVDVG